MDSGGGHCPIKNFISMKIVLKCLQTKIIFLFAFMISYPCLHGYCQSPDYSWCESKSYVNYESASRSIPCNDNHFPCWYPGIRDQNTPYNSTPIKKFFLRISVDTSSYSMSESDIAYMVNEANNYFEPWKIHFCYEIYWVDTISIYDYPL